jgi:hypothetical protein
MKKKNNIKVTHTNEPMMNVKKEMAEGAGSFLLGSVSLLLLVDICLSHGA